MARACRDDLPDDQSGIFLREGLDRLMGDLPVGPPHVSVKLLCAGALQSEAPLKSELDARKESALTSRADIGGPACQVRKVPIAELRFHSLFLSYRPHSGYALGSMMRLAISITAIMPSLRSQLAQFLPERWRGLPRRAKRSQAPLLARVLGKTLDYSSTVFPIAPGTHR
jgi:hypothetical protein